MTEPALAIRVVGTPGPQGSKRSLPRGGRAGGRPVLVESSGAVRPWRDAVIWAASLAMQREHREGFEAAPLRVTVMFWLRPPSSLPKRRRSWPHKRPDLDKYLRATFDALTDARVWADDANVVTLYVAKRYADRGTMPGAEIRVQYEPEWIAAQGEAV